ncbi:zinc finger protein 354C-like isoform X2 [Prorops nasuta]|uniref:zinc finger protein 354C-like isoform X2 n=1 Tax=Prorops nasuta TaxID=863751 RepID=UPI0034CF1CB4
MESEMVENMEIASDNIIMEVLKNSGIKEDIIFETEATNDTAEVDVEEIIEIIEEVEVVEEEYEKVSKSSETKACKPEVYEEANDNQNFSTENYTLDDDNSIIAAAYDKEEIIKSLNKNTKNHKKQVVVYDVDEDWQDEEIEQVDDGIGESDHNFQDQDSDSMNKSWDRNKKSINNLVERSRNDSVTSIESNPRPNKSRIIQEYENDMDGYKEDTNNSNSHEIVKNSENNLVYTVLGSKKQTCYPVKSEFEPKYIKMEQLNENTIPVEGTIYYEGNNLETLYVAQTVNENDQYQYEENTMEQEESGWEETANSDSNQNQEEEEISQDQIFLHEDEDGQLYFKDDNGSLQPVYLTEDGNYAIAENSDDQESSKESHVLEEESTKQSADQESYILPDTEAQSSHSSKQSAVVPTSSLQDLDNEDNTVTISLIISEDEHGQKRTQVIIPTADNMKCDQCNKTFKTSFQLLRHNRLKHAREEDITTRNFPCDLCPKRYPDQNSLARHRKTHTGDRPFQCLECHKTFPTSTALRRHLTLHNSQYKPLPCIYCGRRFMEKASLAKHEQSHLAGDQKNHMCDVCHKSFSLAADLAMHKKYHDPDKKFDCEVCGREFNRLNNLQRHMMVHQQQQGGNEEILSCDVCGITYKFMSSLTRHMVTTHMNPEKLRQQAEEQRRKRENNYRRYLENRKMYETQHTGYSTKRNYRMSGNEESA